MAITKVATRQAPSVVGTGNQVTVNVNTSTGVYTLSLPQSIATSSTPQFGGIGLGIAANALAYITTAASTAAKASFLMTPGVAYTGAMTNGLIWYEATNFRYRIVKNAIAVDFITSANNFALQSSKTTNVVTASGATGDLGLNEVINLFVTDSDIISAINSATFSQMKLATITPANSKVIYQGQEYYNATQNVYYRAIADNQVYILSGDVIVTPAGVKRRIMSDNSGAITTAVIS